MDSRFSFQSLAPAAPAASAARALPRFFFFAMRSPALRGAQGETGETCSCLTPRTSLAGRRGTHLTCRHNTGQGQTGPSGGRRSGAPEGIFPNAYLFSQKLGEKNVGEEGGMVGMRAGGAGVHRIIIHRQNKSRLCLPIRASPVLWRHPFHLAQFQGCRESKATRLLRRPNSCNHGDLVANTPATRGRVLDRMVGISHQNLQMCPIRRKNAERSKTAQPRRLAERLAPSGSPQVHLSPCGNAGPRNGIFSQRRHGREKI